VKAERISAVNRDVHLLHSGNSSETSGVGPGMSQSSVFSRQSSAVGPRSWSLAIGLSIVGFDRDFREP
jgi:hypothetical protein